MRTVAEYRQYAEQCRQLSTKLTDPKDKRVIETMAKAWDKVRSPTSVGEPLKEAMGSLLHSDQ
jgi:hypothetical protein